MKDKNSAAKRLLDVCWSSTEGAVISLAWAMRVEKLMRYPSIGASGPLADVGQRLNWFLFRLFRIDGYRRAIWWSPRRHRPHRLAAPKVLIEMEDTGRRFVFGRQTALLWKGQSASAAASGRRKRRLSNFPAALRSAGPGPPKLFGRSKSKKNDSAKKKEEETSPRCSKIWRRHWIGDDAHGSKSAQTSAGKCVDTISARDWTNSHRLQSYNVRHLRLIVTVESQHPTVSSKTCHPRRHVGTFSPISLKFFFFLKKRPLSWKNSGGPQDRCNRKSARGRSGCRIRSPRWRRRSATEKSWIWSARTILARECSALLAGQVECSRIVIGRPRDVKSVNNLMIFKLKIKLNCRRLWKWN